MKLSELDQNKIKVVNSPTPILPKSNSGTLKLSQLDQSKIKPVVAPKVEQPGALSKIGTFLKQEFTPKGGDVSTLPYGTQTAGSILQSTFGSKSALGVGSQAAKTVMLPKTIGDIKSVEQANMANVSSLESTNKLIELAKTEADPERKRKLLEQAHQAISQSSQIGEQNKQNLQQLKQNVPEPRKILEAGINMALTGSMSGANGLGSGTTAKSAILGGISKFAPKALPIAEKVLSYGRSVLPRAIEQGAAGAAFTGASNIGENKPIQEGMLSSAIIGSLFPVVGLGLSKGAEAGRKAMGKLGVGVENTMLKATPKMFAYGKNPGQGILKEGITFNNFDEGIQKVDDAISRNVDEAKNLIAQAREANPNISVSLRDTTKYIDEALDKAGKTPKTNSALITRLSNVKDDILGYLKGEVDYQAPEKAIELKQLIGKLTKFTGNISDDKEVNMALKRTYGMLMDMTEKVIPGLGDVNGRIADLITALTALENRGLATEAGKVIKMGTNLGRIGALIFGTATLNPALIGAAISEYGIEKVAESPAVRSRIAMWLYKASPAERADIASKAPIIGGIINKIFGMEKKPSIQKIEKELEMLALPAAGKSSAPLLTQPPTTFENKFIQPNKPVKPLIENLTPNEVKFGAVNEMTPRVGNLPTNKVNTLGDVIPPKKSILPKKAEGVIPETTQASKVEPVIPKEQSKLDDLKNQLEIYNTMIDEHPAFPLTKFANKRNQELPEVIGGVAGRFGREGDSIVTEYGFSSSEDARDAYQHLVTLRQQRDAIKEAISNEKSKVAPVKKILPTTESLPKTEVSSLEQEAKKFKSAEEFVNAKTKNVLFHGTSEPIEGGLRGGAYDNILWTAKSPDVAQNYIPESGISSYYSFQNSAYEREKNILPESSFSKAALELLGFDSNKIKIEKLGPGGSIDSYSIKTGVEIPKWGELDNKLKEMGYKDGDLIKITYKNGEETIMPNSYKKQGELYLINDPGNLKWYDMRDSDFGGDQQYNQLKLFKKLQDKGYDGVIINDIAQSKIHGNVGHESYGLFPKSVDKLEKYNIPATNFDWREGYKVSETPEFTDYKNKLKDIWNKANKNEIATTSILPKTVKKNEIIKTDPILNLKKDVAITEVSGKKAIIPAGEALTPYQLKDNKILLKDGEEYIVSKNQYQNVKGQSVSGEAKPFAPELKGTEETIKGASKWQGDELYDNNERLANVIKNEDGTWSYQSDLSEGSDTFKTRQEAMDYAEAEMIGPYGKAETKYSQYQLPDGKNYKEILIKAPKNELTDMAEQNRRAYASGKISLERYKDNLKNSDYARQDFFSTHWEGEPNVISHLRMNERTYNGKKVTFMEELQSDWAREGRAKGFDQVPTNPESLLPNGWKITSNGDTYYVVDSTGKKVVNKLGEGEAYGGNRNVAIGKAIGEEKLMGDFKPGVPNNPLLKNWQEPTIKRALKEAVDNGSDYFAWINGDQTAARYNLSKDVKSINWASDSAGKQVTIKPINAKEIMFYVDGSGKIINEGNGFQKDWVGKPVSEVIGKGIGDKVSSESSGKLSGEGLNVGGEWAKNLYDKQVKNIVEELTGQKVEVLDMGLPIDKTQIPLRFADINKTNFGEPLKYDGLKIGIEIEKGTQSPYTKYIITDILGDGKFKAVPKKQLAESDIKAIKNGTLDKESKAILEADEEGLKETFDISTKKSPGQQAIKITPEIRSLVKGESIPLKQPSGKTPISIFPKKL